MSLPIYLRIGGDGASAVVSRFAASAKSSYGALGAFLATALPKFWADKENVEQESVWCAECARCDNAGVVIVTRQEAQGDLVGAALARQTMYPHEAELVVNVATQQPAQVRDVQLEALRLECARMGLVLGRSETKRIWVAL